MPEEQAAQPAVPKLEQLQQAILGGNIPQLVLNTISFALESRSSDIHIEPLENTVRVRYRIDGVLRQIVEYPTNIHPAVVSRVKIMSNLKIDEQRIPQDGRSSVTTRDGKEMDLRISTLPTVNGEKVVMRIQDKSRKIPDLPELGLQDKALQYIEESLSSPNGIILNTGPTGSGKTTTLYSCLNRLNKIDVNIMTIEDPVEISVDGLNQSQVHPDINYTFAFGMRTGLRQDPDIIMVGEIRDKETVDTAIEASLTGHLVFSTIHTNSAVETLTRIDNMEVPPFLMAATIECIIAQRLVRKICDHCKVEEPADPHLLGHIKLVASKIHADEKLDPALLAGMKFYKGQGCDQCEGVGYRGRLGLFEVMKMNNELRKAILSRKNGLEIEEIAMRTGMLTLEQAGIVKALKGETSLDEVYRVARKMEDDLDTESTPEEPAKPTEPVKPAETAKPVAPKAQPKPVAPAPKPEIENPQT